MAAAAQPVMEREVVKCGSCLLNQYMTRNELCRRCKVSLRPEVVAAPTVAEVSAPVPLFTDSLDHKMALSLRLCRQAQGLSQRDLAKRMGAQRTYVSKMENGGVVPSLRNIPRFAEAIGVSMHELVMLATL